MTQVIRAHAALPILAVEWQQNPSATVDKFKQFIAYHDYHKQVFASCLYLCALLQLARGDSIAVLHGYDMTETQMKRELGI